MFYAKCQKASIFVTSLNSLMILAAVDLMKSTGLVEIGIDGNRSILFIGVRILSE